MSLPHLPPILEHLYYCVEPKVLYMALKNFELHCMALEGEFAKKYFESYLVIFCHQYEPFAKILLPQQIFLDELNKLMYKLHANFRNIGHLYQFQKVPNHVMILNNILTHMHLLFVQM